MNKNLLISGFYFLSFRSMLKLCSDSRISHLLQHLFNLGTQVTGSLFHGLYPCIFYFELFCFSSGAMSVAYPHVDKDPDLLVALEDEVLKERGSLKPYD